MKRRPAEFKFASAWLDELHASGEFLGKAGELAVLHQPQGIRAKRLVAVGGGKRDNFDLRGPSGAGGIGSVAKQKGRKRLAWWWLNGGRSGGRRRGRSARQLRTRPAQDRQSGIKSLESFCDCGRRRMAAELEIAPSSADAFSANARTSLGIWRMSPPTC